MNHCNRVLEAAAVVNIDNSESVSLNSLLYRLWITFAVNFTSRKLAHLGLP
jgi:hypothetical protein